MCPWVAPTGKLEHHISGDVSFAVQQCWWASRNKTWITSHSLEMIVGIAEFWASRVRESQGQYVIDGVIPPDEYAVDVNNSVYTNVVAKNSLEFAAVRITE